MECRGELSFSEKCGGVDDEGGSAVAKNGGAAEKRPAAVRAVELFHDDLLLADKLVDYERGTTFGELDEHYLPARHGAWGQANALAQPDRREHVIPNHDHFAALHLKQ